MSDDTKPGAEPKATPPEPVTGSEDLHATDLDLTEANASVTRRPSASASVVACSAPQRRRHSGYGGLRTPILFPGSAESPTAAASTSSTGTLEQALGEPVARPTDAAIERVVVDRGELTLHVRREACPTVARALRDDPALRFEICTGVSRRALPRTSAAASCTRSTTCSRSPTTAACASR